MVRINDEERLKEYIRQYDIKSIFTADMTMHMELLYFRKNEFIAKEGEEISYLLFLIEGKAKVFTSLSNGKSLLLCFYQGFKVLGDLEAVDSVKALTNVQAIADTYCVGIPYRSVRRYLLEDAKFLRYICTSLGGKLNRCSKNSSINLLYPLENRLASYIYTAGERVQNSESRIKEKEKSIRKNGSAIEYNSGKGDASSKEILCFHENLTEIAELLGTSYRHLLRTLSELCDQGILKKEGSSYIVTDERTLMELSADLYK
ncbi:cyclic nucleotide-binding domain-containing protein [Anaerocolumna sp. AGMB13020]|uniref:cyclic nucleotide-binding domain-containing protein n=1 Tax=Anaerocolumna sp. AGMB13020 TaxID=3081750 RepID=UPI0029553557|nr:cyclic nucleotide-binding domain-containing protein [Anaerocolumna sp. AGMB13020]WOO37548.1 cyclic nucleotide-binding domain-containing protein [Anaerocolumna sp. AGMB13020]